MSDVVIERPAITAAEREKIEKNLQRIGLGRRFATKRFDDLPQSEARDALWSWVMSDEFPADAFAGTGASLYGEDHEAYELFMVLARATHLRGVSARVIGLSVLVHEDSRSAEIEAYLHECRALFVAGFYRSELKEPLTTFQRLAVDEFLMDRLDNGVAVFTVSDKPLAQTRSIWSKPLIRRLEVSNGEYQV